MGSGVATTVGVWVGMLSILTLSFAIRDRRASIYKSERDAEREDNKALREKLVTVTLERDELAKTRTLEPVLAVISDLVDQVTLCAHLNQATIDKLDLFNGTLKHIQEGMRDAAGAMNTLTGAIPAHLQAQATREVTP